MTASTPPRTKRRTSALTNTNTDTLCAGDGMISKGIYRFNLWTGLYMLNPYERFVFHAVGWFTLVVSLAYFFVFWSGFRDGLIQDSSSI
jgi:hypothetical protein